MEKDKNEIIREIEKLEAEMQAPDFWNDKNKAQATLRKLAELKEKKEGVGKYDKGSAVVTIISGAGGDDAEDFSAMLLSMYLKYSDKRGWRIFFIHENKNEHNGYRNVSFEIQGKNVYSYQAHNFYESEWESGKLLDAKRKNPKRESSRNN